MKRVLIATLLAIALLATARQSANAYDQKEDCGKEDDIVAEYETVDSGDLYDGKCWKNGNLLPGKKKLHEPSRYAQTIWILCVDGEPIERRVYDSASGTPEYIQALKNGKQEGLTKHFYHSGKVSGEIPYKNDKREGVEKSFYESGELSSETPYKNGVKDGIAKGYKKDGKLNYERPYKNGKLEGIEKIFYEDGRVREETYKNGFEVGIEEYYDEERKLKYETAYKNHVNSDKDGIIKIYYDSGQLGKEETWKNGAREGETKVYRLNGTISVILTYENNNVISGVCHKRNGEKKPLPKEQLVIFGIVLGLECD
ncbi:MAG: toxin-antitoxin system YwqK family antitoxin [Helicobacteraceae bacterium]|jgi:antitoxin component YwqK of YwqJK toxin-antitoxin module|nr:toxin-antitoxin system YwqK family antitoxin [Helicobacteraceae bacterium]